MGLRFPLAVRGRRKRSRVRRPRTAPLAANRFAVTTMPRSARELLTIDAAYMHGGFPLWASAQDRVDQGDRPFTLVGCEGWKAFPPIVRLLPPADVSDPTIAVVRRAFEAVGAHVRVLARDKARVIAIDSVDAPAEPTSFVGIREAVVHVMRHEVKSAEPAALAEAVEQTMLECGL